MKMVLVKLDLALNHIAHRISLNNYCIHRLHASLPNCALTRCRHHSSISHQCNVAAVPQCFLRCSTHCSDICHVIHLYIYHSQQLLDTLSTIMIDDNSWQKIKM